jgi:hypothetical protein
MAAVRHTWMFRIAAVIFLFFGCVWLWRFGFTDYHPEQRLYGLIAGVLALVTGGLLLRPHRVAIGISGAAAAVISVSAAVFAPNTHGPAILFLAALAIVCCVYAVLSARVLFQRRP